jgi:hypothetical protein
MVTSQMMAMRKIVLKTLATRPYKVILKSQVNTEAALFQIIHTTPTTTTPLLIILFKIFYYKQCICFCQTTSYTVFSCHVTIHISSEKYNKFQF